MKTREEFIDGYVTRSGIERWRTPDGYDPADGHDPTLALPCNCGEPGCEGWAMIPADSVRFHLYQNTDAEVADATAIHTTAEGVALARAYFAGQRKFP